MIIEYVTRIRHRRKRTKGKLTRTFPRPSLLSGPAAILLTDLAWNIIQDIRRARKVERYYLLRLYFGVVRRRRWRLETTEAALFSLFGTLALLLTLSYDDDRVVNNLGLDCLSKGCWNERYFCRCPIDSSLSGRRNSDFSRVDSSRGRSLGSNNEKHDE
jgi:hypothetical protein